ncbi:MAG: hypothetical protein ACP5T1_02340 [Thermoplasmata archaeon]
MGAFIKNEHGRKGLENICAFKFAYVGTETATKLLDHFKSIENVSKASVMDLKKESEGDRYQ